MPSHVIRNFTYDPSMHALEITFVSGKRYRYADVPEDVASAMTRSFAKGEFFNQRIRDRYAVTRLDVPEPDLFSVRKVSE